MSAANTTPATGPVFRLNPLGYLFKLMWRHADARHRFRTILFYGLQVIAMMFLTAQPYAIGEAINVLQQGGPDVLHDSLLWLSLIAASALGFWAFHGPARHIERLIAFHVYDRFITSTYRRLTELPLAWHQDHHSGDTINRVRTAAEALRDYTQDQYIVVHTVLRFAFSGGMLLWISPMVGGITVGFLVVIFVVVLALDKRLVRLYHQYNEGAHQMNATFFDYVSNMTTLLMLRLTALSATSFARAVSRLRHPFVAEVKLNEIKWFIMDFSLSIVSTLTLILYVADKLSTGATLALGAITMIFQYQNNLGNVVRNTAMFYGRMVQHSTSLEAIAKIDADYAALGRDHRERVTAQPFGSITIRNLLLRRQRGDGLAFNLSVPEVTFKAGERIALIGGSGGGKSTLLCLLCGIYAVDQGELQVDGTTKPLGDLHDIATLIPQDPEIFENTIRFNITLGTDGSDEKIMRAVALAGFDGVLAQMPDGLETDIREKGVNLSVGQKQRLALARGLFAAMHSNVILMDEPTSSVDLETEERLFESVFAAFPQKTVIASMHRLHLLPQFDRVWVMQGGKLVVDGTVRDLLTQPGPVRELFERYGTSGFDDAN